MTRAEEVLQQGADVVAIGRGALANPDFPGRAEAAHDLAEFDHSILGPIANIKDRELAM